MSKILLVLRDVEVSVWGGKYVTSCYLFQVLSLNFFSLFSFCCETRKWEKEHEVFGTRAPFSRAKNFLPSLPPVTSPFVGMLYKASWDTFSMEDIVRRENGRSQVHFPFITERRNTEKTKTKDVYLQFPRGRSKVCEEHLPHVTPHRRK